MTSFVYFIQANESGRIKIGYSNKPQRRLKRLQTGCPEKLDLILCVEGIRQDESNLHLLFTNDKIQGEWFAPQNILEWLADDKHEIRKKIYELRQNDLFSIKEGQVKQCFDESLEDFDQQGFHRIAFDYDVSTLILTRNIMSNFVESASDTDSSFVLQLGLTKIELEIESRQSALSRLSSRYSEKDGWVVTHDGEEFGGKGSLDDCVTVAIQRAGYWAAMCGMPIENYEVEYHSIKNAALKHGSIMAFESVRIEYDPDADYMETWENCLSTSGEW